jgi:hypothetical protein
MPAGVEIYNDVGTLLLENNLQNLQIVRKETRDTFLPVQITGSTDWHSIDFFIAETAGGGVPLIACYCETAHVGIVRHFRDESLPANQYYVEVAARHPTSDGFTGIAYTIYQFEMVKLVPQSLPTFGLEMKDATGNLTYHSSIIPLRIGAVLTINGAGSHPSGLVSYGAGRKWAFATGKGIGYRDPAIVWYLDVVQVLAGKQQLGGIDFGHAWWQDGPQQYRAGNADKGMALVVDVTEL